MKLELDSFNANFDTFETVEAHIKMSIVNPKYSATAQIIELDHFLSPIEEVCELISVLRAIYENGYSFCWSVAQGNDGNSENAYLFTVASEQYAKTIECYTFILREEDR